MICGCNFEGVVYLIFGINIYIKEVSCNIDSRGRKAPGIYASFEISHLTPRNRWASRLFATVNYFYEAWHFGILIALTNKAKTIKRTMYK